MQFIGAIIILLVMQAKITMDKILKQMIQSTPFSSLRFCNRYDCNIHERETTSMSMLIKHKAAARCFCQQRHNNA